MIKKLLTCLFVAGATTLGAYAQVDIAGNYTGGLDVSMLVEEQYIPLASSTETISLVSETGGTYAITIDNFSIKIGESAAPLEFGKLEVKGIAAEIQDNFMVLSKEGESDGPVVGGMTTKLSLENSNIAEDKLTLELNVAVYTAEQKTMDVLVEFTGDKQASGIAHTEADKLSIFVSPESNVIDIVGNANHYVIFNTAGAMVQQGIVSNNTIDIAGLKGGIYVVKVDKHIAKFIKK